MFSSILAPGCAISPYWSLCDHARGIGIELEATYIERAQQCAQRLNQKKVTFIQDDARVADLTIDTVFLSLHSFYEVHAERRAQPSEARSWYSSNPNLLLWPVYVRHCRRALA